jgi:AcrR family transcriptional regulator
MRKRAARAEATRLHVALTARRLFHARWYDEVSLADVARTAKVSLATVTRLFPTKTKLLLAAILADVPASTRRPWSPGDVDVAIDILLDSYEETGTWMIRSYALALRMPELAPIVEQTRAMTRSWLDLICGPLLPADTVRRRAALDAIEVALDVRTWWTLRLDMKRPLAETKTHLAFIVHAILDAAVDKGSE